MTCPSCSHSGITGLFSSVRKWLWSWNWDRHNLTLYRPCSTENETCFWLGNEAREALRQQKAHMVHKQHQLVEDGAAEINFVRHEMESEQRASLMILASVSQERDLVRQEAGHLRDSYHRSEQVALCLWEEVEELTFYFIATWKTREDFHYMHERKLQESQRTAAERDRAMFEVRAILRKYEEEEHKRDVAGNLYPIRKGNDGLSQPPCFWCWAAYWQINTITRWHRASCRGRTSTTRFSFSRKWKTLCKNCGKGSLLPDKKPFTGNLLHGRSMDSDATPDRKEMDNRVWAMATCDTIQEMEDITPTRSDHWFNSSSTSHRLVGRDRPGNIFARFGRHRICIRQHQVELWTPGFSGCE